MPQTDVLSPGDHTLDLGTHTLAYHVAGHGPVLLAHSGGPGFSSRYFQDLGGITDFVTLVRLDPRGTGESSAPPHATYSLPDYAADLEELRVQLGLDNVILLGFSHGGMVAQHYALEYPGHISHLLLCNTAPVMSGDAAAANEAAVLAKANEPWYPDAKAALDAEMRNEFEDGDDLMRLWMKEVPLYFTRWDATAQEYAKVFEGDSFNTEALRQFNSEAETLDFRPRLHEISVPTLVLTGRNDTVTGPLAAQMMADRIPNAQVVILEESGHFTFVEERDTFASAIRRFLGL